VPARWDPWFNRLSDAVTGAFLVGVAYYAWVFVQSSMETDLRAAGLDWSVWPFQLAMPIGFLSAAGRYFMYAAWPSIRPKAPEFQE
jgi:TRAP-type C4-dicarboxylate transport system permease small subunit